MNKRFLSVLLFGLVVASAASFLLYRLVSASLPSGPSEPTVAIMAAARDLPAGTLLKELDIKRKEVLKSNVPATAIVNAEEVIGRGVIEHIYTDEAIIEGRLAPKGAGAGLAAIIPKGKRAVAMRVNDVVGVSGFVVPGMRVDVLIAGIPPGSSGGQGTITKTLLQNVEVLSAGQNIQKDAEGKPVSVPVVNVLVTPEEAEILSLASNETRIQLVLRNPLDTEEAQPPGTSMASLFTGQKPDLRPAAPAARAPVRTMRPPSPPPVVRPPEKEKEPEPIVVEVIHGASRAQAKFEGKQEETKQ